MECKQFEHAIAGLSDGVLSDENLHLHLQECTSCRALYNIWKRSGEVIAEEKSAQVSPFIHTRIMAKLEMRKNGIYGWLGDAVYARAVLVAFALVTGVFGARLADVYSDEGGKRAIYTEYFYSDGMSIESGWLNNEFYEE